MTKIPTKEETLKKIKSDPSFMSVLKKASIEERKQILATIDHVAGSFFDAMMFVAANKEAAERSEDLQAAMKTGDGIIKENDGSPLNSKGQEK